ncbi:MAG: WYL domain-containing protein [Clostridia bacterium]|nr:WYL domain-containing protein [Clostridia bacterium]
MKNQILIELLFLLHSRKTVTAKYIARRYEISERTAYRYIDELSLCVPIYNIRGRNGGYAIADTFKIPSTFFTKEESAFLLNLLNGVNNEISSDILTKIIEKFKSISKQKDGDFTLDFGNLIIDGGPWGSTESFKESITFFEKCIEENKTVSITHVSRDGKETTRDIEPHVLILKQGLWYLYAYCKLRNEFRLFKIGRIERAKETGEIFERRPTPNVKELLDVWYDKLKAEVIELEVLKPAKADVEEWLGIDNVYTLKDGTIFASCNLPIDNVLASKILAFGKNVKVIKPLSLKKAVSDIANEVSKLYS